MPTHCHLTVATAALLAFTCSAVAQNTWTVDDNGPADFAQISAAVLAAADGDTILVRAGSYDRFEVVGKGLRIEGEGTVGVFSAIAPAVRIANTMATQSVVLRNVVTVGGTGNLQDINVAIENCAGPVLAQDCSLSTFYSGYPLDIDNCASVTLSRCDVFASTTYFGVSGGVLQGPFAYNGATVRASNVWIYDSSVTGGDGSGSFRFGGQVQPASVGGIGLALCGSTLFAVNSTFVGGSTNNNPASACAVGADGMPGILMADRNGVPATGRLLDCQTTGGVAGAGSCGLANGATGLPIEAPGGAAVLLPGNARTTAMERLAASGQGATLSLTGQPGDGLLLAWSLELAPGLPFAGQAAALHVGAAPGVVFLGTIPASGVANMPFVMPGLPMGVSFSLAYQCFFVSGPTFFESGPQVLTILGPGL